MAVPTQALTFQYKDDGVVLNTDPALPFVDVESVDGLDNAPYRTTERDFEGADGGFVDAQFEKIRTIVLEGTIYADSGSLESFLDTLKNNFEPSTDAFPFYWVAPGLGLRSVLAKSYGIRYKWTTERRLGIVPFQIVLQAENPSILAGQSVTWGPYTLPTPLALGRGYNKAYNFDYGGSGQVVGSVIISNLGNKDADAVFVIIGDLGNPKITHDNTSRFLQLQLSLTSSDRLELDTRYRTVYLNGVSRRSALTTSSAWFKLVPGTNSLRFTAGISGAGYLQVITQDTYR